MGICSRIYWLTRGTGDGFLEDGLRPWLLEEVCKDKGIELTLRMQDDYDHSYFFISTLWLNTLHGMLNIWRYEAETSANA